jgi:hypothetical protein
MMAQKSPGPAAHSVAQDWPKIEDKPYVPIVQEQRGKHRCNKLFFLPKFLSLLLPVCCNTFIRTLNRTSYL